MTVDKMIVKEKKCNKMTVDETCADKMTVL